jgi:hypothetical protein
MKLAEICSLLSIFMRVIKLFLLSAFFIGVLLFLLSLLLPSRATVERSGVIDAPIATVYSQIYDLKTWQQWNPWTSPAAIKDVSYSDATSGAGAFYTCTSIRTDQRITGKVIITKSDSLKGVYYNMDFEGMKTVKATFNLRPATTGNATVILWRLETELGYLPWWKFRGFVADRITGPQLEDGLTKLKSICEGR